MTDGFRDQLAGKTRDENIFIGNHFGNREFEKRDGPFLLTGELIENRCFGRKSPLNFTSVYSRQPTGFGNDVVVGNQLITGA